MEWGPNGSASKAAAFASYGLPPSSSSVASFTSNDFIQHQHVIHPWGDGAHRNIAEYQIVFTQRTLTDHDLQLYTSVSLAKVNEILDQSYATFEALTDNIADPTLNDADCVKFKNYLDKYGEKLLEEYHQLRKKSSNTYLDAYVTDATTRNELKDFYEMAINRPVLKYLTKLGILLNWNFIGVTLGVNRATTFDESDNAASSERVAVINTIMAKRATTHNIFGGIKDVITGADAYLILRRVQRRGNRGPGKFEFVPYASRFVMGIPRHLAIYSDGFEQIPDPAGAAGKTKNSDIPRIVNSHVIPVGMITQPTSRDAPEGIREVAAGLNGNHRTAYEAISTLPTIHVQVNM
jgi:hypothetical protein